MKKIEILLATFNGEKYLSELLTSIAKQSYNNWILRVADDCSTDNTLNILRRFKERFPERVNITINQFRLGAAENFLALMKNSKMDLVAFCDQDDVWMPNKLQKLYIELERKRHELSDPALPILVYSDAIVVDSNLNTLEKSLISFHGNDNMYSHTYDRLKYRNSITGCTVLANLNAINASVLCADNMYSETKKRITMHDHWIGLIVSKNNGVILKIKDPLVLYRQHDNNVVGAVKSRLSLKLVTRKFRNIQKKYEMISFLDQDTRFISYIIKHIFFKLRN